MSISGKQIICTVLGLVGAQVVVAQEAPILPPATAIPQPSSIGDSDSKHGLALTDTPTLSRSVDARGSRADIALTRLQPTAVLEFSKEIQQPPTQKSTSGVVFSSTRALGSEPFELNFSGNHYELATVSETVDRQTSYRHLTLRMRNVPEGYARLTIAGTQIAGTLVTARTSYRLLSDDQGKVAIYLLGERGNAKYRRVIKRADADAGLGALERRHVQLERPRICNRSAHS